MACRHRFYDDLIPNQQQVNYLFIGTFNPCWNAVNNNNAEYFYGRATSLFWCICPHAFNNNCLVDKGPNEWIEFCLNHNIGLTDIIREVTNASNNSQQHIKFLTSGFEDKNLELRETGGYLFDLDFNTPSIIQFITERQNDLKGVFFTRKSQGDIPRIWQQWIEVRQRCDQLGIYNVALPTPSVRGGAIRNKINAWRNAVVESGNKCNIKMAHRL